jgi:histidine triad (HIT) family protein
MDCIFCAIVAGHSLASTLYDDERVMAFMDIRPATPGHLLVIPKEHAPHLADLDPDDGARMFTLAQRLAAALRAATIPADGINLFLADGEVALQEVFHAHLHVIPRTLDDGVVLKADFGAPSREVLDQQAADLRTALDGPGSG